MSGSGRRITGLVVTLAGVAAMVVASFMGWADYSHSGGPDPTGFLLPLRSLYRPAIATSQSTWTSPGAVLVVLGVIAVIAALANYRLLVDLAGVAAIVVPGLVADQIVRDSQGHGFASIEAGLFVAAVGAVLTIVGGLILPASPRRSASIRTREDPTPVQT